MRTLPRRFGSRRALRLAGLTRVTRVTRVTRLACAIALVSTLVPLLGAGPVQADKRAPSTQCALPNPSGWTGEGETTDYHQFERPQGTKKAAMLFVDFPDAPAMDSTDAYYKFLAPAHDLMTQFSAGAVDLSITPVRHWLHMPQDSASYDFERGISWPQQALYVKQAGELAAQYVDLSKFDLIYIVPPKNATAITFSPAYVFDPKQPNLIVHGKEVKWGVTLGQDMYVWGPKVLVHETSHTFGLPDLYSFTDSDVHHWVGGFDVMGNIIGDAPHHFGWEDWKIGWLANSQVACLDAPGTFAVRLKQVESLGGTKIAVVRTGQTTAVVAESRRPYGVDKGLCKSGVVIYKVNSATISGSGPIRVQNSSPHTPTTTACNEAVDWGAYEPGQTFHDTAAGVTITVNSASTTSDVVTVTKT
ncbi:M6 family metalloprotease domain protein [Catenulispora acidiphila DSM 44928]|uniref:M6 family metalloprotease domain protein n=1 Tax=Catenulispora acidiphila (strain DSM 44928 / JCM 14897 / NBRC 102108 / NRRL B-24433 / ID139908) TaxID=479433 RepID=C7Q1Q8_CATAD|nr:M6 family metalloprotease domain protein [Catenulispora acidiphila DSM 44928]